MHCRRIWLRVCLSLGLCLSGACSLEAQVSRLPTVFINGRDFVKLTDLARAYQMDISVAGKGATPSIPSPHASLALEMDNREATLNGWKVWLTSGPTVARGMALISRTDIAKVIDPILFPPRNGGPRAFRAIVIDPGHGGVDQGTQSAMGLLEKTAALDVALRLQRILAQKEFVVTLTRSRDVTVPLDQRVSIGRQLRADLFVSVHFNSEGGGRSARGIETYCLTPSGAASTASLRAWNNSLIGNRFDDRNMFLAYCVQRGVVKETGTVDRGVRRARFYVLQYAECPAILVECGFLSNASEASQIASSNYREEVANGIADGIIAYKRTLER